METQGVVMRGGGLPLSPTQGFGLCLLSDTAPQRTETAEEGVAEPRQRRHVGYTPKAGCTEQGCIHSLLGTGGKAPGSIPVNGWAGQELPAGRGGHGSTGSLDPCSCPNISIPPSRVGP